MRATTMTHIAFDLDGTLIDSVQDLAASASELVTSLGGRELQTGDVALMVGDGARVLVHRALETAGLPRDLPGALDRFLEIYDRRALETTVAYPGAADMLSLASRRGRLSVVTNKPAAVSRKILAALGLLAYFDTVIGGDGDRPRKPDPAGLQAAAGAAERVMLVGDSPIDWDTARSAGCPFVWARYGFGARRFTAPPDTPYVLDRPSDLAAVLDRLDAVMSGA